MLHTMLVLSTNKGPILQVENQKPAKKLPRLRELEYSPNSNPLVEPREIAIKKRYVRTGRREELVNPKTGEISQAVVHQQVMEKDDAEFVKVFAAGIKAMYDLNRTAARVFQLVLEKYEQEPMAGGYADSLYLVWFDGGLSGQAIGMSEATFNRGLRELVDKGFLYPRLPGVYWTNPNLFFKGDRVAFVHEYRRKKASRQDELERIGQQRLPEMDQD